MKLLLTTLLLLGANSLLFGQNYTSYFTGNSQDAVTIPSGGICLMGGATEHDVAMKWFLQRANGGDVLVLRASGADGYNNYFFTDLGITINSVETIVCNNGSASYDPYLVSKIAQAEAIWFAGGDQWNYISYWRNTPIDSAINVALTERNIVIGGTSAGMAIQGEFYFSAENGTVTSAQALNNPYNNLVTVDNQSFIQNGQLSKVITDTHFDNPDRAGRLATFLGRLRTDYTIMAKAIACNEYVAVCIDTNGVASVYGDYPNYQEFAYFLQVNCEIQNNSPEICVNNSPLTWNQNNAALKVYKVPGTMNGSNSFNIADWSTGNGGEWQNWYVQDGVLNQSSSLVPDCSLSIYDDLELEINVQPNPSQNNVEISSQMKINALQLLTTEGRIVKEINDLNASYCSVDISDLNPGVYLFLVNVNGNLKEVRIIKD